VGNGGVGSTVAPPRHGGGWGTTLNCGARGTTHRGGDEAPLNVREGAQRGGAWMAVSGGAMECGAATDAARDGGAARHAAARWRGGEVKPRREVKRVGIGDFSFFIRESGDFLGSVTP